MTCRLFADDTAVYLTVDGLEDGNVLQTWTNYAGEAVGHRVQTLLVPRGKGDNSQGHSLHLTWPGSGGCHQCKVLGVDNATGISWYILIDRITATANRTLGFIK